jgi:hypothetical protein
MKHRRSSYGSGSSTDQGGRKRRGTGLPIIALSRTRDASREGPKGVTRPEMRETPAVLWLGGTRGLLRVAGAHLSGGSLNPARVNRAFRQARAACRAGHSFAGARIETSSPLGLPHT